jgi:hypothetical protein
MEEEEVWAVADFVLFPTTFPKYLNLLSIKMFLILPSPYSIAVNVDLSNQYLPSPFLLGVFGLLLLQYILSVSWMLFVVMNSATF